MSDFAQYRRSQIAELRPYLDGEMLSERVSISAADREAGSPKLGDMIARNPKNHDDQWLVAAKYFADNFEPVAAQPPINSPETSPETYSKSIDAQPPNAQQVAQTGVPEGCVLVPLEPTKEMEIAGQNALDGNGAIDTCSSDARVCYTAMLAASPAPAKQADGSDASDRVARALSGILAALEQDRYPSDETFEAINALAAYDKTKKVTNKQPVAQGCTHEWVSADNSIVKNVAMCLRCRAIAPAHEVLAAAPAQSKEGATP